jgi:transcriptional regulator with XRE-family HTH domain
LALGSGLILRAIRQQRQLALREVEERSISIARERGNRSYQVSASWLYRLEREEHKLTVNKLIVLAEIYNLPPEQLLRSVYLGNPQPVLPQTTLLPNPTISPVIIRLSKDPAGSRREAEGGTLPRPKLMTYFHECTTPFDLRPLVGGSASSRPSRNKGLSLQQTQILWRSFHRAASRRQSRCRRNHGIEKEDPDATVLLRRNQTVAGA